MTKKFIAAFRGVPLGLVYPVDYCVGDDCPAELEAGALSLGAIEVGGDPVQPVLLGAGGDQASASSNDAADAPIVVSGVDEGGVADQAVNTETGLSGQDDETKPGAKAKR